MGARFAVKHTNLIGFCTTEGQAKAPRTDRETLGTFLMSLAYGRNLISSTQGMSDDWTAQVQNVAGDCLQRAQFNFRDQSAVEPLEVHELLDPLRPYFTGYDFFALVLPQGRWDQDRESLSFFVEAAIGSQKSGLILLPEELPKNGVAQFVDPFPALRELADHPVAPPWVMFWTNLGGACALPLEDARAFYRDAIVTALRHGRRQVDDAIRRAAQRQQSKRILHLSDLHIGRPEAAQRRSWLKQHLAGVLPGIDRVVVTGDLFDTPKEEYRTSFDELRLDVERLTTKSLLVIPGNHDVRIKGNAWGPLGRRADQVIDLDWSPLEIDDDLQTVFFSFNSSEDGDAARGSVNKRQRLDRATRFDALLSKRPELAGYFKVALVHHHPVNYAGQPTAFYEKLLAPFGFGDRLIEFEDAEAFLAWCGNRGISLVLHGHKHVPHLALIKHRWQQTMIVGCGSSTGAEGKPMCYDIVTLNPQSGEWSVSFFHDVAGDGSGFNLQNIAVKVA